MTCWPCWLALMVLASPFAVIGFRVWRATKPGAPWWPDKE